MISITRVVAVSLACFDILTSDHLDHKDLATFISVNSQINMNIGRL